MIFGTPPYIPLKIPKDPVISKKSINFICDSILSGEIDRISPLELNPNATV